jgi:transcriptional regulator with XRE-family HTH domain
MPTAKTPAKPRKSLVAAFEKTVAARGDTITALAGRFGVTRQRLRYWLNGDFASRPLAEKVAKYLESAA